MTLKHELVGLQLSKTEYEEADGGSHKLASQATGDMIYASSDSILTRLAMGGGEDGFLQRKSGLPSWRTPAQVVEDAVKAMRVMQWRHIYGSASMFPTTAVAGSGIINTSLFASFTSSGATAGGIGRIEAYINSTAQGWSAGVNASLLNWSKGVIVVLVFMSAQQTTNGKHRLIFGRATGDTGDPNDKSIGVEVQNDALHGIVHNGSSLDDQDLSTTMIANQTEIITIISDGAGNVTFYNSAGTLVGTSTGGPTGDSSSGHVIFSIECVNTPDNANQAGRFHEAYIGVEQ